MLIKDDNFVNQVICPFKASSEIWLIVGAPKVIHLIDAEVSDKTAVDKTDRGSLDYSVIDKFALSMEILFDGKLINY